MEIKKEKIVFRIEPMTILRINGKRLSYVQSQIVLRTKKTEKSVIDYYYVTTKNIHINLPLLQKLKLVEVNQVGKVKKKMIISKLK